jgi:hypothetical protein
MLPSDLPRAARRATPVALLAGLLAAGCGDGAKTYPVSGTVTIDGAPFAARTGTVTFVPDRARGNAADEEPAATVDADGRYTLYTKAHRGAPPGWYKVVVTGIGEAPPAATKGPLTQRPAPKSLVPARYGRAATTPLEVEVVASPQAGAYDLNLKP